MRAGGVDEELAQVRKVKLRTDPMPDAAPFHIAERKAHGSPFSLKTLLFAAIFSIGFAALAAAWPDSAVTCDGCLTQPVADCGLSKAKWPASRLALVRPDSDRNRGFEISLLPHSPVRAVQDGVVQTVVRSEKENIVILKHERGTVSVYAHLAETTLNRGDKVRIGDKIGLSGYDPIDGRSKLYFGMSGAKTVNTQECWSEKFS